MRRPGPLERLTSPHRRLPPRSVGLGRRQVQHREAGRLVDLDAVRPCRLDLRPGPLGLLTIGLALELQPSPAPDRNMTLTVERHAGQGTTWGV